MEAVGRIAKAPAEQIWNWILENSNAIAAESSVLAKGWHLFAVLFLLCILVLAIAWFIVVKATQVTLILTIGFISLSLVFASDG